MNLSFPVVLPTLQSVAGATVAEVGLPQPPTLPSIKTIVPDTLKIQTQVPNLSVVGFTLTVPSLQGQNLVAPPIPGVVVIPGNIGFLDQFFSVMLMVSNAAPAGSNLVVSNLTASIVLPAGDDTVVGSADDPLVMAQIATGESPRTEPVTQPGPDGVLGTADDVSTIGPGENRPLRRCRNSVLMSASTKQRSCDSGLAAVASPSAVASARTDAFDSSPPSGKTARVSCA